MDRGAGPTGAGDAELAPQAARHASEARLRLALDLAELGTWSYSLVDGSGHLDERAARIVGLPAGRFADVAEARATRTHPDDLASLQAAVAAGVASGAPFELRYRVVHPDGSVHHVASRAIALCDERGRPVRIVGTNRDVTADREAEARLRASEARYHALFDSIGQGFCVLEVLFAEGGGHGPPRAVDYRFVEANPAFAQQTGLADAVGRTIRELAPAEEPPWCERVGRVALTGEPTRFEAPVDALGRWYDVHAFRVGEPRERRVAVLFDDVTAQKRATAERERRAAGVTTERERLRAVVLQTPAPLALLEGPEHRFVLVNDAYKRVSGGGRDVTGLTPREAFPELAGSGIHELFDRVYESGEPWDGPETLVRYDRDGTGVQDTWFDLRIEPVRDAGGRVTGVLNFCVDATERVRARREVERLLRLEQRARAGAEEAYRTAEEAYRVAEAARAEAAVANRAKDEFLALISHELRSPLAGIASNAQMLAMGVCGPVSEGQARALQRIRLSQAHLLGLIDQLLDLKRAATGHLEVALARVRVADVMADAAALVEATMSERALRFAACLPPPELAARADPDKLRQILLNLLGNASKFTPAGGAVELTCDADRSETRIRVRDTGIGIPADMADAVFEPFVQVRDAARPSAQGTGLGLAISRDLARAMGGDLTVESAPALGSVFTLALPRA
jgi:PAS domain S-box-containing protein